MWEEVRPVVLLVITVDAEVLLQGLVGLVGLTIAFWVITRGEVKSHAEGFTK